ncbi:MAG: sulfotransferase domain-containing protein [Okeania sp. SIO3B5]|uniref:sulfotransferase domain-containing protein n=1 Tax=Okeania sp. SIO3B5 TaxID=2607811 RepID=UPI0013FF7CD4|nr:sulfotransferase domain-containing protein [Okeania sp. SIO3B5]NEO57396.1 sulfotransferase domain-containing protein [Okeania sp. SIO3B5]
MLSQTTRRLLANLRQLTASKISNENRKKIGAVLQKLQETSIGRWYSLSSADAYIISFPKCGRTWLRLMIGRALQQKFQLSHPNINEKTLLLEPLAELGPNVPKIMVTHDDDPHWKKPEELELSKNKYKNVKIIFLARDPRDVVVSAYFEQKKRVSFWLEGLKKEPHLQAYKERIKAYDGDLSTFIYEEIGSLDSLIKFYNIWAENRHIPKDFLLIRYEDLHKNPHRELRKSFDFLGIKYQEEVIDEAVEYSSFDNMRKMETEGNAHPKLKATNPNDTDSYKTRKGKVGGFTEYFTEAEITYINNKINANLSDFYGYK